MPRRPMEGRRHAHVITDRRYTGSIPVGSINTIIFFDEKHNTYIPHIAIYGRAISAFADFTTVRDVSL